MKTRGVSIVCVFLFLFLMGCVYSPPPGQSPDHRPPDYLVQVPHLVQKKLEEAQSRIAVSRLKVGKIATIQTRDRSLNGVVVGQNPRPGVIVPSGSTVDVSVYRYAPPQTVQKVVVPDISGRAVGKAGRMLAKQGLKIGKKSFRSTAQKNRDGLVASQTPGPGAMVSKKTAVDVSVYRYTLPKPVPSVVVPDLSGETAGKAGRILKKWGLKMGKKSSVSTAQKSRDGLVASQIPKPGAVVPKKTVVGVSVYRYKLPEPAPGVVVPNLSGMAVKKARRVLKKRGLQMGKGNPVATVQKSQDGLVASQSVKSGAVVAKKSVIGISVYKYTPSKPVRRVVVPDLSGATVEKARKMLVKRGLNSGQETFVHTRKKELLGKVASQNPGPGKHVMPGTLVDFSVYRKQKRKSK